MSALPAPAWPTIVLAAVLLGDAIISVRPVRFVRECVEGVGFPISEWGWVLVYVKLLAVGGLLVGLWQPGIGAAATVGVIAYFLAAAAAHVRARVLGVTFWVNCLGMLVASAAVLVYSFVL
ncbi:DoxX family protein [Gordonia sp. (in: high G+C Gram-positive bacteria)]|uniref:DoxX family protein n=1 Tax=Gordonia sp. (in: high G+C Gram-positive bacteria) TaxID=84139 RepID=UPI003C73EA5C